MINVTFSLNKFKAVDNTNPTFNSDIRYLISPKGEIVDKKGKEVILEASNLENNKFLISIHNQSEDKLNGLLDLWWNIFKRKYLN